MKDWRQIQKTTFTRLEHLVDFLQLDEENRSQVEFRPNFPVLIPHRLAGKMPKNVLCHPITRQFLPLKEENRLLPGYSTDPLCEESGVRVAPAALHKYQGRLLLVTSGACAMHCRYCFRQNFSYASPDRFYQQELAYLRANSTIHEVILSGGDPLSLSDERLAFLLEQLDAIEHVKLIRFHSRFPVGIPERIDHDFLALLQQVRQQVVFVLHVNCVEELDTDVLAAMRRLQRHHVPTLAQTVLLRDVNDTPERLHDLLLTCGVNGILPYYLHKLDPVRGAHHFDTTIADGTALLATVRKSLPGYCLPRFVTEQPGQPGKTILV